MPKEGLPANHSFGMTMIKPLTQTLSKNGTIDITQARLFSTQKWHYCKKCKSSKFYFPIFNIIVN